VKNEIKEDAKLYGDERRSRLVARAVAKAIDEATLVGANRSR